MPKDKETKTKKTDEKKEKVVKKTAKSSGKGKKFADMSATAVIVDEAALEKGLQGATGATKTPKVRGKKYLEASKKIEAKKTYSLQEALELLKKVSLGKNNWTLEAHFNVTDKGLSGEVTLPHYQGKAKKVIIFDEKVAEALKAGKIDFDILLATSVDMPKILPFAKLLGPKGLMPNPKNGTLVPDPKQALTNFSGKAIHFKTEKDFPLIHTAIGKIQQPTDELVANFEAMVKAVNSKNIKKAILKSTMSPGVKVAING